MSSAIAGLSRACRKVYLPIVNLKVNGDLFISREYESQYNIGENDYD